MKHQTTNVLKWENEWTYVEKKLKAVNGVFETIDHVNSAVSTVSDVIVAKI